ncbi:MAG: type II toxin-antitoxin system HicA family toxin [Defluviitaleaceae bacterium]|nr:type II toxin-antitoxin system HicA family toxin [Defluviitaleaceae bacterium]
MKPKDLLKKLYKSGWELDRIKGSHHILKKGDETLSIPVHNKDLKPGLLKSVLKIAELD